MRCLYDDNTGLKESYECFLDFFKNEESNLQFRNWWFCIYREPIGYGVPMPQSSILNPQTLIWKYKSYLWLEE